MNLLKLAAEYGTPEWDQEWQDAKHNVKMQEKHVKKVPKEMAEDMAGYGGMAGMALGMAPGIPAAVRAGRLFAKGQGQMLPGDIEKMVGSAMGSLHGAIGGSLLGAGGGYLYGKNKVKPEEERLRRYQDQYMNLEEQIPVMEDIPAPQEKQAAMDPEEQALYDRMDQAEEQAFNLRGSIPDDIRQQQSDVRRKESLLGGLSGAGVGAGVGGALGAAAGLITRRPSVGRSAMAGSVPAAMVGGTAGGLLGAAKGNQQADQILQEQNPELHGQIRDAWSEVDQADDAITNYYFPQKEAEAYLTGLQKMAAPVTEEEINEMGNQLNETTDQINQGYQSAGLKGGFIGGGLGAAGGLALSRGLGSGRGPALFTGGGVAGGLAGVGIGQSLFGRRNKELIDSREAQNDALFDKIVQYNEQMPDEEGMG